MMRKAPIVGGLLTLLVCATCSTERSPPSESDSSPQNLYLQFEQSIRAMAGMSGPQISPDEYPGGADAFVHTGAPLEFWVFLAVLYDDQGHPYTLRQRFARADMSAAVRSVSVVASQVDSQSEWSYTNAIAMDYQFDLLADSAQDAYTLVQREALGLAGTHSIEERVWLGAFEATDKSAALCQPSFIVRSPELDLRFGQSESTLETQCDDDESPGTASSTTLTLHNSQTLPVSGRYQNDQQSVELNGFGWVLRGWGVPPDSTQAAVIFDNAWLVLQDLASDHSRYSLQLQRSRRVSGRGPKLSTGTVQTIPANGLSPNDPDTIALELLDADNGPSNTVPAGWLLNSTDYAIKTTLHPLTAGAQTSGITGQNWFGVVEIKGSHSGYGFINYSVRETQ